MTWEERALKAVNGDMAEVYALLVSMAIALDTLEVDPPSTDHEET